MAGFGLINMNRPKGAHDNTAKINRRVGVTFGRLYDPYLQRFLSPDNVVQDPLNAQNYNRYSYCLNNPLMYTDPTGWQMAPIDQFWNLGKARTNQARFNSFGDVSGGGQGWGGNGVVSGGGVTPGFAGYHYDEYNGVYRDNYTNDVVSFGEVYYTYVLPNAWYTLNGKAAIAFMKGWQHIYAEKKDIRNQPAMPGWPKLVPSNKTLIDFARKFFGQYKYLDKVSLIYDDVLTSEKKDIANVDDRLYEGKYNIFFSTDAFSSSWQLFMSMGHEFVHVANFIENPGIPVAKSEWASYNYEAILCKNIGFKGGELYYNGRATEWYDGTPRGKYWVYDKWGLPTKYAGY